MLKLARRTCLLAGLLLLCGGSFAQTPATPPVAPALMLAGSFKTGIHLPDYWVSEKLDGVRGHWTGHQLLTRGGQAIAAPAWFTAGWPAFAMDGELWAGRGRFSDAVSTVRRETPDDDAWQDIRFMAFDLPAHAGRFDERVVAMASLPTTPWLQVVPQRRITSEKTLMALLRQTERQGGEGLMLHRGAAHYQAGRSNDILKLKSHEDAEAQVMAWEPGKGKYQGLVGALLVQTPQGTRFKLGSGLSDVQRREPPPPGTWVTYRYRGVNDSGVPRFATFLRVREDMAINGPPTSPR